MSVFGLFSNITIYIIKNLPYIPFYTVYPSVLAVLHHQ